MTSKNSSIRPFLTVSDAKQAITFYAGAFGAVEKTRFELPGAKLSAVLEIGSATFYVADEEPDFGNRAPSPQGTGAIRIILETPQADELFDKALQLGALSICPMTTEDDWRIGKLQDPFGHVWEIGFEL